MQMRKHLTGPESLPSALMTVSPELIPGRVTHSSTNSSLLFGKLCLTLQSHWEMILMKNKAGIYP